MTTTSGLSKARRGAALGWIGLVAGSIVAILALHQLGSEPASRVDWSHLWDWLGATPSEQVILALGRSAALALSYWILLSTLLYTAARATRVPALVRSVEWFTLPVVRRVVERVVAVSLSVSTLTAGGAAAAIAADVPTADGLPGRSEITLEAPTPDAGYVPIPAGGGIATPLLDREAEDTDGYVPKPAGEQTDAHVAPPPFFVTPTVAPAPADAAQGPVPAPGGSAAAASVAGVTTTYTIQPGDHLWSIAERHVADVLRRTPTDAETATYWAHLVEVNRAGLRSGKPDLVFPGETIECPPVSDVGLS